MGPRHISPSAHSPWEGGTREGYTQAQERKATAMAGKIAVLRVRGDIPATFLVQLPTEPKPGDNMMPGFRMILCPVIGARRDRTKLLVIAPDGSDQWVAWRK